MADQDDTPMEKDLIRQSEAMLNGFARKNGLTTVDELIRFPKYIQIETVSSCNARCVMCPVDEWERSTRLMSDELFDKITGELEQHADWIEQVCIQLDGEPLIDKKIEQRIRRLKSIGIRRVNFASNGSLMTPDRARRLMDSGLDDISFSIDGVTAEVYEAIRVRLKFDEVMKNVEAFIQIRDEMKSDCQVRIRMVVMESNRHEYQPFMEYWKKRLGPRDDVYGKALHNWSNWVTDYNLPQGLQGDILNCSPCHAPWSSLVILSDGRVPLCCSDFNAKVCLGDVTQRPIADIWHGEVVKRVRNIHMTHGRKGMPMCIDCTVWDEDTKLW